MQLSQKSMAMKNVLDEIVAYKRTEIAQAKSQMSVENLQSQVAEAPPVRDFVSALDSVEPIGLITEVKKASPSASVIRASFDPVSIAKIYEQNGANCISVLTDERYFQGHLDYLSQIRQQVSVPLLRKDFILDPYQVLEARAAGADAVLLIAECLSDSELGALFEQIQDLEMTALIEIYEPENLQRVLALKPHLIGINNRNLRTFETSLQHTIELAQQIPADTLLVSESGIRSCEDVRILKQAGAGAILVGETLMRSADPGQAVAQLLGREI